MSNKKGCGINKGTSATQREVLIMNGNKDYLIPGVHYAPEVTLNILSINLLKQQGFKIVYEGDICTLEYMFKNQHGRNIDVDKIRQRHNDYLRDYFESLNKERTYRKEEEPGIVEDTNTPVFGQEFGALTEIPGLTRSDGEDIRKCYMTYLEVFVSYYKTARAPENPMTGEEDMESLEEYQWNLGKKGASSAVEKKKERLEHFRIKLEKEEESKQQQPAYHWREAQIKCYNCQGLGHYAIEFRSLRTHKTSVIPLAIPRNSASALERATTFCLLLLHVTRFPPTNVK
nr:ARID DNA-binding domain-containing protein [Tanacetum cinerariifolium]